MFKKISLIIMIFFLMTSSLLAGSNIYISVTVNNEIITNYDIKKEKSYLMILNPNLSKLNDERVIQISKNSLINEIIKKKELKKIFNLEKKIPYLDRVYKDLYNRLNYV